MQKELQLVRYLYDENVPDEPLEALLEEETLKAEYEAMSIAKQILDRRPQDAPNEALLTTILQAAEDASKKRGSRHSFTRILQMPATRWVAAACITLIGIVAIYSNFTASPDAQVLTESQMIAPLLDKGQDRIPAWEVETRQIGQIHQQVQRLEAMVDENEWGEVTPLEMMPANANRTNLQTVGSFR